jgi:hypothetical protein
MWPQPENVISGKTLMDIIKNRIEDPFVEMDGRTYVRFDRITATGRFAVVGLRGIDLFSVPIDGSMQETLVLEIRGLVEVTP